MAQWLQSMFGDKWVPTVGLMVMVPLTVYLGTVAVRESLRDDGRHTERNRRAEAAVAEAKRRAAQR